ASDCGGTTRIVASIVPPKPPTRNLRPLRSSTVLSSLRNQPPICAPVLPAAQPTQLYFLRRSLSSSLPPPKRSHEFICRLLRPNGSAVPKVIAASLPQ